MPSIAAPPAVEFRGVDKRFGGVRANSGVSFRIAAGTVHGLVGENGAGKSTLMHMLYGSFAPDAGSILLDGQSVKMRGAQDAIRAGIGMVHQHFMLVKSFSVIENILLGAEGGLLIGPALQKARLKIRRLCEDLGLEIDPDARVADLSVGELQRIEIVKALYRGARTLILDEPTAVLTPAEVEHLQTMIERLRQRGSTVIVISHKLKEIMSICERVTVMRAGAVVAERDTRDTNPQELAELMVGRKVRAVSGERGAADAPRRTFGPSLVEVLDLCFVDAEGVTRLQDVSLELRAGEILGIAGVAGNGQSELLLMLAGMLAPTSGEIRVSSCAGAVRTIDAQRPCGPCDMRGMKVGHVPEDRHRDAMVMDFPAWENAALGHLDDPALHCGPFVRPTAMRARCRELMQDFDVRPAEEGLAARHFSGGNQQKLVMAREHAQGPAVLLVGQPTRGVDIGAIELIHARLRALRDDGCAVLLVSSELDEILDLSDRVAGMSGGRITGVLSRADATRGAIGTLMGESGVRLRDGGAG